MTFSGKVSQATNALEDKMKRKIEQVNSKSSVNIKGLKKQNQNNECISIYYSHKNIPPKNYTHKKHCITRNK